MMLPILISVSVAPVSYFFWSVTLTLVTASIARAAENIPNRKWMAVILISLVKVDVSFLVRFIVEGLLGARLARSGDHSTSIRQSVQTKSPCGIAAGAALLV